MDNKNFRPSSISQKDIKFETALGVGQFGVVFQATWTKEPDKVIKCAIKVLQSKPQELIDEIQRHCSLYHENIVQIYGFTTEPMMMVLELCDGGTLQKRLQSSHDQKLSLLLLQKYSIQTLNGMCYLESKNLIHRDLATRNILLCAEKETVKIADFGLSRYLNLADDKTYYRMENQVVLPICWCAPESLQYHIFNSKTDVWAFGVTLWEMLSYGGDPLIGYGIVRDPNITTSIALEVRTIINGGNRLNKSKTCTNEFYDVMYSCWASIPENRPTFTELLKRVINMRFNITTCINKHSGSSGGDLIANIGDQVIVIEEINYYYFGQNQKTGEFGKIKRDAVRSEKEIYGDYWDDEVESPQNIQRYSINIIPPTTSSKPTLKPKPKFEANPRAESVDIRLGNVENNNDRHSSFQSKVSNRIAQLQQQINLDPRNNHRPKNFQTRNGSTSDFRFEPDVANEYEIPINRNRHFDRSIYRPKGHSVKFSEENKELEQPPPPPPRQNIIEITSLDYRNDVQSSFSQNNIRSNPTTTEKKEFKAYDRSLNLQKRQIYGKIEQSNSHVKETQLNRDVEASRSFMRKNQPIKKVNSVL